MYEAAVIERLKESGFLEIEIRTESLMRCGDGYQDEVINAGWHYWNAALSARVQDVAGMKHVGWRWKHADTPEEGHWHYEGGTEKPDPGFRPAYAELVTFEKVYAPAAPAKADIAALEAQLKHLITTRKNKAALAAFDNDTRMWFIAQLTGTASGRVPLTDIEALVARHLPPATDTAPLN
ncbi:hypothetical protein O8C52_25980 [Agrobacterium rhizogenes]|nr:hypothetical protein [Rhizobium rhizogenes]